jgi:hypothetical protein
LELQGGMSEGYLVHVGVKIRGGVCVWNMNRHVMLQLCGTVVGHKLIMRKRLWRIPHEDEYAEPQTTMQLLIFSRKVYSF